MKHRVIMGIDSRNNTSTKISKKIGCTYSVSSEVIQYLKKNKILSVIKNTKNKKEKQLYLTARGLKIREALEVIWDF